MSIKTLAKQLLNGEIKGLEIDFRDKGELIETINLKYSKRNNTLNYRYEIDFPENDNIDLTDIEKINIEFISNAITDIKNSRYFSEITIIK